MKEENVGVKTEVTSPETSDVTAESSTGKEVVKDTEETEEQESTEESEVEESTTETTETTEKTEDSVDKGHEEAVPYERFQELDKQKVAAEQEATQLKPLADQAKVLNEFLQSNRISNQEFESALKYLQLLRTDPQAAYGMLRPTYEQLATLSGDILPPDLQAEVAAGTIKQERAFELAKARANTTWLNWRQQNNQQGNVQDMSALIGNTIQAWIPSKQSIDPDFRPKASPNAPDGLFELADKFVRAAPPFKSVQEAIQGCEKAYNDAKAFIGQFRKINQVRRGPTGKQSSTNTLRVVKTAEDVAKAINAGVRPSELKYS